MLRADPVVQLVCSPGWARPRTTGGVRGRLLVWDGGWFMRVAERGLPDRVHATTPTASWHGNGLAFFPRLSDAGPRSCTARPAWSSATAAITVPGSPAIGAAVAVCAARHPPLRRAGRPGAGRAVLRPADVGGAVDGVLGGAVRWRWSPACCSPRTGGAGCSPALLGLAAALTRPTGAAAARRPRGGRRVAGGLRPIHAAPKRARGRPLRRPAGASRWPACPRYLGWVGLRVGDLGRLVRDPDRRLGHHVRLRRVARGVRRATRCAPATAGSR